MAQRPNLTRRLADRAGAAAYANVSVKTIDRRIADGSLPAYRFGRRAVRVSLNDIDALMQRIPTVEGAA